ncbi:MAG: hypothetical protein SGI86_22815 [Deltaproteobacteria bacterium]|nr:hypothetical protein [Deltaproteobacteria bacterium]
MAFFAPLVNLCGKSMQFSAAFVVSCLALTACARTFGGDTDNAGGVDGKGGGQGISDGSGGNTAAGGESAMAGGATAGTGTGGSAGGTPGTTGASGGATAAGGATATGGSGGTVVVPIGKVPMFVAAGHGARTITSCDDGRTWIANHSYENRNVDHSPYTEKGMVYGDGIFMELIGWGADPSVKLSTNGVDWQRFPVPNGGGGGLVFVELPQKKFVTVNGYGGCQSSPNGKTWTRCTAPDYPENLRESGGGGAAIGGGGDIAATFSFDGGQSWRTSSACRLVDGFGNLGQLGGFAWGNSTFCAVGSSGDWCRTTDRGATWQTGKLPSGVDGKMAFIGDKFWAPNGATAYWSSDGSTWTRETLRPTGTVIHAMARGDSGTFVGIQRENASTRFYRSSDGINWTLVTGPTGTSLRRVVFGYGTPSAQCPLP